jgi:hypothetical protein
MATYYSGGKVTTVKKTEYIEFVERPSLSTQKTKYWDIYNRRHMTILGHISWHGPWRQYCFFVHGVSVFSVWCLIDISKFIAERMEDRKNKRCPKCDDASFDQEETVGIGRIIRENLL